MLCGSGTTGCHGLIEAGNEAKRRELGKHVLLCRSDITAHLEEMKGVDGAREWMRLHLLVEC
jgi:hypothetical protein